MANRPILAKPTFLPTYLCRNLFGRFDKTSSRSLLVGKTLFLAFVFSCAVYPRIAVQATGAHETSPTIFNSIPFPDFGLTASLPNIVPADGATPATSIIIVSPSNGFTGTVTLSDPSIPATLMCTVITPSMITNLSGNARLSCSSNLAGTYNVTILGTSNTIRHNATATLRFATSPPPDFTMAAISPVTFTLGSPASSNLTLTPQNGFDSKVNLTSTIEPTIGLSVSLNPQSIVSGSETSTVAFNSSIPGDYTVQITGISGSLLHIITIAVTVTPIASDFGIAARSNFINVEAGKAGATTITITPTSGFMGTVTLTVTAPSLVSCSLSPSSVHSSGSSSLTCNSRSAGNYSVTINATSGVYSHATTVDVHVAAASPVAPLPAPSTILGLPSTLFYGIVGVIVIVAVTGTLLVFRRSSRSLS